MKSSTFATITGLVGVVTLSIGIYAVNHLGNHWCLHGLPNGLSRPLLAMELVRSSNDVQQVLGVHCSDCDAACGKAFVEENRIEMRFQQRIDRGFIPAYSSFLFCIATVGFYRCREKSLRGILARLSATAALFATALGGAFDYLEDQRIDTVLMNRSNLSDTAALISQAAFSKWSFLFAAMLGLFFVFWDSAIRSILLKWIGGTTAATAIIAGFFGLAACFSGNDAALESAAGLLFLALMLATVYFLSYRVLTAGTLRAFDSLASGGVFGQLAKWPLRDREDLRHEGHRRQEEMLDARGESHRIDEM